jgi:RNA polymerase sigma-70 factor (ECF subfamily)
MTANLGRAVRRLVDLVDREHWAQASDAQLLRRFADHRDEGAFAALVKRHGPLVLGVCRRLLASAHDAEDACQATFLVLARQAAAIRKPHALASWLHGVALRVARKLRAGGNRRRRLERQAPAPAEASPANLSCFEVQSILDEELHQLPERHRQPLVLCHLKGLTQQEAAAQLGWPRGTLKRRLERGRALLKTRLLRRGLAPAAIAAALPGAEALAATFPSTFAVCTSRAAVLFAARQPLPAGLLPSHVISLAEGVLVSMLMFKCKLLAVFVLALVLGVCGGLAWARQADDGPGGDDPPAVIASTPLPGSGATPPPQHEPAKPAANAGAKKPVPGAIEFALVVRDAGQPPQRLATGCGGWGSFAQARLPLAAPPRRLRESTRQIDVEIRLRLDENGSSKRLLSACNITLPWGSGSVMLGEEYGMAFSAEQDGDQVLVRWWHLFR